MNIQHRTSGGDALRRRWTLGVECSLLNVSHRSRQARRRGFTLIEILLAVTIFAIVLFAMNTVFYSALRLERATNRSLDERTTLNQALAILRRDLQGAVQPISNGVFNLNFISGAGSSMSLGPSRNSSLEFATTTGVINDSLPWGDLQRVRYELTEPADRTTRGQDLVRVITRNLMPTTTEEIDTQWLMGNVESLEFLGFDGSGWQASWDTSSGEIGLPQAVRVRVLLAANNTGNNSPINREPIEMLVPLVIQSLTNQPSTGGAP